MRRFFCIGEKEMKESRKGFLLGILVTLLVLGGAWAGKKAVDWMANGGQATALTGEAQRKLKDLEGLMRCV